MPFTTAIYYPYIEVRDEGWLKSSLLYWDTIRTIVPISIAEPYTTPIGRELQAEGVLIPVRVSPEKSGELLDRDLLTYLESPEGLELLRDSDDELLHVDKMSHTLRYILAGELASPDPVQAQWLRLPKALTNLYMTALATRLAHQLHAGLLTNVPASDRLANLVRLDAKPRLRQTLLESVSEGVLSELTLVAVGISQDTPLREVLKFRKRRSDELGRFRTRIAQLAASVSTVEPLEAAQQGLNDVYANEVRPAVDELVKALADSRIKWAIENFLKVAFFSAGSSSFLGLSGWHAFLATCGVSLVASAVLYKTHERELLRGNPFSYVLSAQRKFK